ncbi:MAG: prolyl oligopeptidase family serine peptidase [Candidatus Marinimicrobia bacterium]|nr:prolyl oligopeptidase family serine peptidase [Candidatus Neomarinimicrobiota bacterium]MBT3617903.1 prolyl oligopeptidase family serine peptidase [Candidatus Neomarinimicrobiota bacterium]MBT3828740.1 prolyl oligopeptidase family serine peptidase [Candidatus Neomarinimicrobiota bacterium]MBT3997031.1 prolyl oligopeptidase family serine peptidase [Candidatus Neomarinimicrobiota bacterium]MBT4280787.1 prolyl oligopeptidase family serine peptidase [Candidatus Neomarinimicrobiota bacterium]
MILNTHQTSNNPEVAILALHGWSGDEDSMVPVAKTMRINDAAWYIPRAPYASSSGNGYTWFSGSDEEGWKYKKSFSLLNNLMSKIRDDGFSNDSIYLVGFSMGASLALEFALRVKYQIGGIIPIAGFIKDEVRLKSDATKASRTTPILILHGEKDDIVHPESGQKTYDFLSEQGYCVKLITFRGGHKIPFSAGEAINTFISEQINFASNQTSD